MTYFPGGEWKLEHRVSQPVVALVDQARMAPLTHGGGGGIGGADGADGALLIADAARIKGSYA